MNYTALVIVLPSNYETFTLVREVDTDNLAIIYSIMKTEAWADDDDMDTILLFKNGPTSPEVVGFWRAANGDFEGL